MNVKTIQISRFLLWLTLFGFAAIAHAQGRKDSVSSPRIDVQNCDLTVNLIPDTHELQAVAVITFKLLETTNFIALNLNENLLVQKVLNSKGVELEFSQNQVAPEVLVVRFETSLASETSQAIRIEYEGGFDQDRYSRMYSRDSNSAYIGMERTSLMYAAKWFPVNQFLADRATGTLEVTVPLGMTVIGSGRQMPVVTKGISETFIWNASTPILPGSFVAGPYFSKNVQVGDFAIECFAQENKLDSIQKSAETAGKILAYFQNKYGLPAAGNSFRLVEVEDSLARQPGMAGTIFVTRRELALPTPPVRELARRIAYQWWQETVGVQNAEDLWLADGMAYFSAAQYLGDSGGVTAFKEEIDSLAVLALKFENKSTVRLGWELGFRTDPYESVVAGKGAWIVNMLRGIIGDSSFEQLQQQYLREGSVAGGSTALFQKLAGNLYGKDIGWFFSEWIDAIGIPTLQADYVLLKTGNGFRISGSIKQERDLFRMPVELAIVNGEIKEVQSIELNGKSTAFDVAVFAMPENIILDPNNKLLRDSKELRTSVQISLGNDLRQTESFVEAIRAYEGAIKLSPHRSLAHFHLAEVFYEQFNLQSAANSFRDALNGDKDPKWIEVWCYIYLGKIYDILGQRQRAMAEYTKALNTKDDTNGAQNEAGKWLAAPFTRERTVMDSQTK
jgi:aminopeptidase N